MTHRVGVAAFDFDGTITRRDTLGPFLVRACGRSAARRALTSEISAEIRRGRRPDRDTVKLGMLRRLFPGWTDDEFAEVGRAHARSLPATFRPATLERLRWHRDEGHRLVIVSASLGTYLRPLGDDLGLDEVIAVELEVGDDGRLTGATIGPNVRGPEKARRLEAWTRSAVGDDVELWAYGNSRGDLELLAMADHPYWVGRRGRGNGADG